MAATNALPAAASHFVDDKAAMRAALDAQQQQQQQQQAVVGNPAAPAWGNYLYQSFLLPAFSPSEWIATTPSGAIQPPPHTPAQGSNPDYFAWQAQGPPPPPSAAQAKPDSSAAAQADAAQHQHQQHPHPQHPHLSTSAGPSAFYSQSYYPPSSIPTSLLHTSSSSSSISPSVDVIDTQISISGTPSPHSHSHPAYFHAQSPPFSASAVGGGGISSSSSSSIQAAKQHGVKRRASSLDSESHDEHDIAEGVERDGMIWGMKVEDYRALSARERKRVRNRISARTFRAKRKEHLSSLETDLEVKDNQIKAARDEASRLRQEVAALKKRLAQYEQ